MKESRDQPAERSSPGSGRHSETPLLVEDVLLLLFQPRSGAIAGESTLFYVLGGAVLAELAMRDMAQLAGDSSGRVTSRGTTPPREDLLRSAWDYISTKPRSPQTVIAAVGPDLRNQVVETLVSKGHLRRTRKKLLGIVPTESIALGSARREELLSRVRAVLVDEEAPDEMTAAVTALLSASTQLHQLDPDIPWTSRVIQRAREFEVGDQGAAAAGWSVNHSTLAVITALAATAPARYGG
ncbi:GPP34 family phosphoprotein [Brachybacterium sp. FME24]|uniref:GOLPH3/VPS74 family protein n=1 Tax=Brachybacterium sp. FME24 TaxID=2742605 RepID=UPI0018666EFC|nr:GPP34 family phosphoprotein [Brachybacterium sp. FME24]